MSNTRLLYGLSGALYLAIIVLGVWSEGFARGSLIVQGDPLATATNVLAREGLFRLAFAADLAMALCDVGLGVALFLLLQASGPALALAATAFRLAQAAIIGASLLGLQAAVVLLRSSLPADEARALAAVAIELHGLGYDLGLVFFGVSSLLTGALLKRSPHFPSGLGVSIGLAGVVYLLGSGAALLWPAWSDAIAPLYLVPLLAETALCFSLLRHAAPTASGWLGLYRRTAAIDV